MIDLRTDEGLAEAIRTIAEWPASPTDGADAVVLSTTGRRRARRLAVAAAAVVLFLIGVLVLADRQGAEPLEVASGEWRAMAPSPLSPRFDYSAVWTGDELVVWGGIDPQGNALSSGAAYDPTTDTWRRIARFTGNAVQVRGGIRTGNSSPGVWAGSEAIFAVSHTGSVPGWDLYGYDPEQDSWRQVDRARFEALPNDMLVRTKGSATVDSPMALLEHQGKVIVFGWRSDLGEFGWSDFDPESSEWSSFRVIPGSGELYALNSVTGSPVIVDGRYLVWVREGRATLGPMGFVGDLLSGTSWPIDYPAADPPILEANGAIDRSGLYVGVTVDLETQRFSPVAALLDPATGTWTSRAPVRRFSDWNNLAPVVAVEGGHIVFGGLDVDDGTRSGPTSVAVAAGPVVDRWADLPEGLLDSSRVDHIMVWTGEELIIWGGATSDPANAPVNVAVVPLNDGAIYVPG